jgi:tellurite resistance protein
VLVFAGCAVKLVTAFGVVRSQSFHPIAGNLLGTFLISLLLPILLEPYAHCPAQVLWVAGAAGMLLFARLVVGRWMSDRQQVALAIPVWIVPVVGLLDVPLALPSPGPPRLHGLVVSRSPSGCSSGAAVHADILAPAA